MLPQTHADLVHCRPKAMEGLARLRVSDRKVTIVTNGTADTQFGKIQRKGLAEVVDRSWRWIMRSGSCSCQ